MRVLARVRNPSLDGLGRLVCRSLDHNMHIRIELSPGTSLDLRRQRETESLSGLPYGKELTVHIKP